LCGRPDFCFAGPLRELLQGRSAGDIIVRPGRNQPVVTKRRDVMQDITILLSRILMSAVFIVFGWIKFTNVASVATSAATKRFMDLVASGAPAPTWLGYLIAAIELFGGLAILVVLYIIIITALGHPFWLIHDDRVSQMSNFYKNLAIIGGYLLLAVTGAGRYSFDHRAVAVTPKPDAATA
jgi:putative oxidoreductase